MIKAYRNPDRRTGLRLLAAVINSLAISVPLPPHAGERHPDGDEVLFMVSGRIDVHLELDESDRTVQIGTAKRSSSRKAHLASDQLCRTRTDGQHHTRPERRLAP